MNTLKYAFKKEWYDLLLLLVPFAVIPFIWDAMPEQMPTHWNIHGEADDYSSKPFALFFLPVLNILLYFFLLYIPLIDPKKRIERDQKPLPVIRFFTIVFLTVLWGWAVSQSGGIEIGLKPVLFLSINLFLLVMGNYLKTIQPNYFIGIRVPWTLEDPGNWKQTHKIASYFWVGGSVLLFLLYPFFPMETYSHIFFGTVIAMTLIPVIYSFYLFKTNEQDYENS